MSQIDELKKALSSLDSETLQSTYSTEQLSIIENLLSQPDALAQSDAVDKALGRTSPQALPVAEEMSKIGQGIGGAVAPLLGGTQTGVRIGETGGAVVGGLLTRTPQGMEAGRKAGGVVGGLTQSALKAATGGIVGYETERQIRNATNDAELNASLADALRAGGEEAMWDVAGNSLVKSGSQLFSLIKFKPKEGSEELQKILEKEGSTLALDQMVDNGVVSFLGELLRGSRLSAGPFDRLASDQADIVVKYYDDIIADMAGASRASLENAGMARLVRHALKDGKRLHGEAAGIMFDELDKAVQFVAKERTAKAVPTEQIPEGFEDVLTGADLIAIRAGQPSGKVAKFKRPVSLVDVRKEMQQLVKEMKIRGTVDPTGQGVKLISDVGAGAKQLSFRDTHELLSELKRLQRDKTFSGPIKVRLPEIIGQVQKSFDDAASQYGGNIEKAYKRARTFSKMGANRFNNKFVKSIVDAENPSEIGRMVAQSAPEEIIRLKKALSLSKTRQGADGVDLWPKVQGGVLEVLLPQNIQQLNKSAISQRNVDRELKSRLIATLGSEGYKKLDKSLVLVEEILEKQATRGNFNNRLAGVLLASGAGWAAIATDTLPQTVTAFILAPKLLARAMTNPKWITSLTNVNKTSQSKKGAYAVALAKLIAIQDDISREVEKQEQQ